MYNPIEIQKVTKSGAHSVTLSRINHLQLMTMAITLPSGAGFLRDAGQHDAEDCHGAPAGSAEHLPVARHLSGSPEKLSFFTEAEIFQ